LTLWDSFPDRRSGVLIISPIVSINEQDSHFPAWQCEKEKRDTGEGANRINLVQASAASQPDVKKGAVEEASQPSNLKINYLQTCTVTPGPFVTSPLPLLILLAN
jgi:hypothetical protein